MLSRLYKLIKNGEIKFVVNGISKRLLSKTQAYGLKRDMRIPFPMPNAQIDIAIRLYKEEDDVYFRSSLHNHGLVEQQIPKCYIATTLDGEPCFRQWLIGPEQQTAIKEFWGPAFPDLKYDEMLLEDGFTVPHLRGKGIMPASITRIIEAEGRKDITSVITFVGVDNIASLKGIHRSGFLPYTLRTEKWFLFQRKVSFEDVSEELLENYHKKIAISIKS